MILLADENLDQTVLKRLREDGHEVLAVVEMEPGITDEVVLTLANDRKALLVTEDKDFGELVFRQNLIHHGVILLRLAGLSATGRAVCDCERSAAVPGAGWAWRGNGRGVHGAIARHNAHPAAWCARRNLKQEIRIRRHLLTNCGGNKVDPSQIFSAVEGDRFHLFKWHDTPRCATHWPCK